MERLSFGLNPADSATQDVDALAASPLLFPCRPSRRPILRIAHFNPGIRNSTWPMVKSAPKCTGSAKHLHQFHLYEPIGSSDYELLPGTTLGTMWRRSNRSRLLLFVLSAMIPLLCIMPGRAQQSTSRLILKDGSYQSVVKYEVQGDRVRYFSAERYEWEEVPSSMIDWDATNKYAADLASGKARVHTETPEEREEREAEEANSPEIAPGLRLPGTGGVFLFETYNGKQEAAEILQNGSEVNQSKKKNVLRAAINPAAGAKQSFELKGAHAQIQAHSGQPVLYVDIEEGATDIPVADRFRIVRAQLKNDVRVVGNLRVSLTGKTSQESTVVPTTVEKVGKGQWLKVTPTKELLPGEYALVEMLGPQEMNLYVWDFGVNPQAPANPNVWRPATP